MLKHLHLLFVALVTVVFLGRVYLAQTKPELLENKWFKIAPHALAGLLLLTGIGLVFQGFGHPHPEKRRRKTLVCAGGCSFLLGLYRQNRVHQTDILVLLR
jgi:hypothetical protein